MSKHIYFEKSTTFILCIVFSGIFCLIALVYLGLASNALYHVIRVNSEINQGGDAFELEFELALFVITLETYGMNFFMFGGISIGGTFLSIIIGKMSNIGSDRSSVIYDSSPSSLPSKSYIHCPNCKRTLIGDYIECPTCRTKLNRD